MDFYADLHIHSRYSRATSKDLDLEHLVLWARKKGITVLGTGDFTHPAWMAEIKNKLVPAEPGLFRLREDLEQELTRQHGATSEQPVRFMLEVEISTIYKKGDKVRKVHHLLYAPDLEKADRIVQRLSRIGNLTADGRPILGLDSRDLLEITLEGGDGCFLIPAHIWTPWFSVFGSKSGFDALEECYGDLTPHIFALETGLSSDPPMNGFLSALDRYTLVSNSDAHSPPKLGREACRFRTDLSYFAIKAALETSQGFDGTVEFFPEEGKYHLDGHRACGVRLEPEETRQLDGRCPACGKPLTVGVLHRVHELADRVEEQLPPHVPPFHSLIPLVEVLSEIQGSGPSSKAVAGIYESLTSRMGSELFLLQEAPLEDIRRTGPPLLDEALRRMRSGQVIREGGYDGEYGTIRLFQKEELARRHAVSLLFDLPEAAPAAEVKEPPPVTLHPPPPVEPDPAEIPLNAENHTGRSSTSNPILDGLDPDQRQAAEITDGPLLILAGPGTGKTRTLTHRIAHLVVECGVPPEACLAITFTRRAADEMRERLAHLLPDTAEPVPVMTFHSLGLSLLRAYGHLLGLPQPFQVAADEACVQVLSETLSLSEAAARKLLTRIRDRERTHEGSDDEMEQARRAYRLALRDRSLVDFDDLVELAVTLLEQQPEVLNACRARYQWVSIDEYQDVDERQYRLVKLLVPPSGNLCVIGDPDQAIYGFRGSDVRFFQRFREDYPQARTVHLTRNYRSNRTIVEAALQAMAPDTLVKDRTLHAQTAGPYQIEVRACTTDRAEAEFTVHTIERLIGGTTFFSFDSGRVEAGEEKLLAFSDFAVLYRTEAQTQALEEAFARSGLPYQKRAHGPLIENPTVRRLIKHAQNHEPGGSVTQRLNQAVRDVQRESEGPDYPRLLESLRPLAERCGSDFDAFCSELALGAEVDLWDERADRVSLLTLHASKGLEFRVVFLVGCEDGILPLRWGTADGMDIAEERRLFFVGMTRARDRLFLTYTRRRLWRGSLSPRTPSPFLNDIQEALLNVHRQQETASKPRQLTLF